MSITWSKVGMAAALVTALVWAPVAVAAEESAQGNTSGPAVGSPPTPSAAVQKPTSSQGGAPAGAPGPTSSQGGAPAGAPGPTSSQGGAPAGAPGVEAKSGTEGGSAPKAPSGRQSTSHQ
jgi:hypothetical protein